MFVTPPGWWHSHHNESDEVAWVLPMQDAGLYTHQRTLDIRFVDDELALHKAGKIRGSAFAVTCRQYTEMVELGAPGAARKKRGMKRVWSAEKDVATGAKMVGMKRVASCPGPGEALQLGRLGVKKKTRRGGSRPSRTEVDESTASEPRLLLDESAQRRRMHNT